MPPNGISGTSWTSAIKPYATRGQSDVISSYEDGRRLQRRDDPATSSSDDLVAGSADAAKKGKIPPLDGPGLRLPARDVQLPLAYLGRGARQRGDRHQGRLDQLGLLGAALLGGRPAALPRAGLSHLRAGLLLRHHGGRPHRLLGQAGQADRGPRADATSRPPCRARSSRSSTASCPTWASTSHPTGPMRIPPTCCPAARSPRPGRPPRRPARRSPRTSSG